MRNSPLNCTHLDPGTGGIALLCPSTLFKVSVECGDFFELDHSQDHFQNFETLKMLIEMTWVGF